MSARADETARELPKLPKLPIGISDFERLRREGCPYVDKTGYIVDMIDSGSFYFLSRPRRFGKSVMISAFEALLSGRREMFEGLAAEGYFERSNYRSYPVVRINMDKIPPDSGADGIRSSIAGMVRDCGTALGIGVSDGLAPGEALRTLLFEAEKKIGPVALLIDAADDPIIDLIHYDKAAREIRHILREFFTHVKNSLQSVRFMLINAVSRLSKGNVLSSVGSIRDISNSGRYAETLGFTEEEVVSNFSGHIDALARARGEERNDLILKIRDYYSGYSFGGSRLVYNPHSVLNFLAEGKFKNYWFDSASQRGLSERLRKHDSLTDFFRGIDVDARSIETYDIESSDIVGFLFQSGYLSIRERNGSRVTLDYPNKEVLSSMAGMIQFIKLKDYRAQVKGHLLEKSIEDGRVEDLIKYYNLIIADIPPDILVRAERKFANMKHKNAPASLYHSMLFSLIWSARMNTLTDGYSYGGRTGVIVEKDGRRYIIDLRVEDEDDACIHAVGEAMASIRSSVEVGSSEPGGSTAIAMAIDRSARRVNRFLVERL
ncbi:MAG: AAA family ATPase [Synergistaceae bacterium]|jgi:hypothetical protein|nr:AAA family ATPase [Synergistaceae bacterium]